MRTLGKLAGMLILYELVEDRIIQEQAAAYKEDCEVHARKKEVRLVWLESEICGLNPQISDCCSMRTCFPSTQWIWQILRKSKLLLWVRLIFYSNKIYDKALKENLGNIQMFLLDCQKMICHLKLISLQSLE